MSYSESAHTARCIKRLGQFMSHTMLQDMAIKYKDASLKNNYDQIVCIMLLAKTYSPVGFRQYLALDCEFVRETSNFWHSKHFLQYTFYTFFFTVSAMLNSS